MFLSLRETESIIEDITYIYTPFLLRIQKKLCRDGTAVYSKSFYVHREYGL